MEQPMEYLAQSDASGGYLVNVNHFVHHYHQMNKDSGEKKTHYAAGVLWKDFMIRLLKF